MFGSDYIQLMNQGSEDLLPDDLSTRHIDDRNPILRQHPPDVVQQLAVVRPVLRKVVSQTRSGLSSRVEQLVYQIE